ncbi:MAG: hypothetical protein D6816_09610 [Bacteroidetes bacterium]|nr:MAG: hypothetical protein D6816_09610 [Bacteroidota bacterium]
MCKWTGFTFALNKKRMRPFQINYLRFVFFGVGIFLLILFLPGSNQIAIAKTNGVQVSLNVPFYSQTDLKPDPKGGGQTLLPLGNSSLNLWQYGCGVASLAMIFEYHGVDTNLVDLNDRLRDHGGFSGALLNWPNIQKTATTVNVSDGLIKSIQRINTNNPNNYKNRVDESLQDGEPVMAFLNNGHYVVIVGKEGEDTYRINDPWGGQNTLPGKNIKLDDNLLKKGGFDSITQFVFVSPHENAPTNGIVLHHDIAPKYVSLFGSKGPLKNPLREAESLPDVQGVWQEFEKGAIFAPQNQPPLVIFGALWETYQQAGGFDALGIPQNDTYVYFLGNYGTAVWRTDFTDASIIWVEDESEARLLTEANGIRAEYFDNDSLSGKPAYVRYEPDWLFDWQQGTPSPSVHSDNFSIRFTQEISDFGLQRFVVVTNEAVRVSIDGDIVYNTWDDNEKDNSFVKFLGFGKHDLLVEYRANTGPASLKLAWAGWPVKPVFADTPSAGPLLTPTMDVTEHVNFDNQATGVPTGCKSTASSVGMDLILPIEMGGKTLKTLGGIYNTPPLHQNQDLCALDFDSGGMKVVAVADGKVEQARWYKEDEPETAFGYYVHLSHKGATDTYHSFYAHLEPPENTPEECRVIAGMNVKAGQCIGISGSTGYSIPADLAHLHFSMFQNDYTNGPNAPYDGTPLAPETMRGLFRYGTLEAYEKITTMATAVHESTILPETGNAPPGSGGFTIQPGDSVVVTFNFKNTSQLTWDASNQFAFARVDGSAPEAPEKIPLNQSVAPGETVSVQVPISAANNQGTSPFDYRLVFHRSEWQLQHNDVVFGPSVDLRYAIVKDPDFSSDKLTDWLSSLFDYLIDQLWQGIRDDIDPILAPFIQLWQEIQKLLDFINALCATLPATILIGLAVFKRRENTTSRKKAKLPPKKRESWWNALRKGLGTVAVFILTWILLFSARELLWWPVPVRNIGFVVLILAGVLFLIGVLLMIRWILIMRWQRLALLVALILAGWILWQGNRYYQNVPIESRYKYAVSDVSALSIRYGKQQYHQLEVLRDDLAAALNQPDIQE